MKIRFTKSALTTFGLIEAGSIVNLGEQEAAVYIQAGLADLPEPAAKPAPKARNRKKASA